MHSKKKGKYYVVYEGDKFVKHLGRIPKADADIIAAAITEFPDLKALFSKDKVVWLTDAKIASLYKTEPTIARALDEIRKKRTLNPAFPKEKFSVVLADPPWRYDFDVESRATKKHIPN